MAIQAIARGLLVSCAETERIMANKVVALCSHCGRHIRVILPGTASPYFATHLVGGRRNQTNLKPGSRCPGSLTAAKVER